MELTQLLIVLLDEFGDSFARSVQTLLSLAPAAAPRLDDGFQHNLRKCLQGGDQLLRRVTENHTYFYTERVVDTASRFVVVTVRLELLAPKNGFIVLVPSPQLDGRNELFLRKFQPADVLILLLDIVLSPSAGGKKAMSA